MSASLNPYQAWLGIPANDQPPNHYRLLGLRLMEADAEKIGLAAKRQAAKVRPYLSGDSAATAQKLIRAIGDARNCLLDANAKAAYDSKVGLTPGVAGSLVNSSKQGPQSSRTADDGFNLESLIGQDSKATPRQGSPAITTKAKRGEGSAIGKLIAILVPTIMTVGLGLLLSKLFFSGGAGDTAASEKTPSTAVAQKNTATTGPGATVPASNSTPKKADGGDPRAGSQGERAATLKNPSLPGNAVAINDGNPKPPEGDRPAGRDASPAPPKADPFERLNPPEVELKPRVFPGGSGVGGAGEPSRPPAGESDPKPATRDEHKKEPPLKKSPVPATAALAETQALIKEIFGKEVAAAKSSQEKSAVAEKLILKSIESKDDSAAQYALLLNASDLAQEIGDLPLLMKCVDRVGDSFDIDLGQEKLNALTLYADKASQPGKQKTCAEFALKAADDAAAIDDYERALSLGRLALNTAKKLNDPKLVQRIIDRGRELVALKGGYAAADEGLEKSKSTPDDPAANLAAGKWFCLNKRDFAKGLPYLAKGSDAELRAVALLDLANPADVAPQIAVADAWWEIAQKNEVAWDKNSELRRTDFWYHRAAGSAVGLAKAKIERRMEEIAKQLASEEAPKIAANPETAAKTGGPTAPAKISPDEMKKLVSGLLFEVVSLDPKTKMQRLENWEFKPSGAVEVAGVVVSGGTKSVQSNAETVAKWDAAENVITLQVAKPTQSGSLTFTNSLEGTGIMKTSGGSLAFSFQFRRIAPAFMCVVKTTGSSASSYTWTLYSNGNIGRATGGSGYWAMSGNEITLKNNYYYVDGTYLLSNDRKAFTGRSQGGYEVTGTLSPIEVPK